MEQFTLADVERHIDNLLVAQAMMLDITDEQLTPRLNYWINPQFRENLTKHQPLSECGGAACFGGWCAMHPHYQAQGLMREWDGEPYFEKHSEAPSFLFGSECMFSARQDVEGFAKTDKQIVEDRIKLALNLALNRQQQLSPPNLI